MRRNNRNGSALIAALWTIALLSMLVMSFAVDANLEAKIVSYIRLKRQADYLIKSGVPIAELVMEKQASASGNETNEQATRDRWLEPAVSLKRGQKAVLDVNDEVFNGGTIHIEIEPEPSRWNINKMGSKEYDLVWEQIFTTHGIPEEYWETLVSSFNDWLDADSTTLPDGAEDDYYKQLDPPYKAKNGILDTVGELSLVKGFSNSVLYGGVINPEADADKQISVKGIAHLFTIYGDGKINVNAASVDVLMTIPKMDELLAGAIIEEREGRGDSAVSKNRGRTKTGAATEAAFEDFSFKTTSDVTSRIPGLPADILSYITTSSDTYRLTIEGRVGSIVRQVQAVVTYDSDKKKLKYLKYREDP